MKIIRKLKLALIICVVFLSLSLAVEVTHKKNRANAKNTQFISKID
jgi:hypothetical protein